MRTLTDNGRADLAYTIATQKTYPGWGYMVEKGATTIWELWNGDTADPAMNSGNHVMQIGDLACGCTSTWPASAPTPKSPDSSTPSSTLSGRRTDLREGDAQVALRHHRDFVEARRRPVHAGGTIPPNTSATVSMPAKDAAAVTESGSPAASARGVSFLRTEGDSALFELESAITFCERSRPWGGPPGRAGPPGPAVLSANQAAGAAGRSKGFGANEGFRPTIPAGAHACSKSGRRASSASVLLSGTEQPGVRRNLPPAACAAACHWLCNWSEVRVR